VRRKTQSRRLPDRSAAPTAGQTAYTGATRRERAAKVAITAGQVIGLLSAGAWRLLSGEAIQIVRATLINPR
jgi:hypothetical protein